jgi:hypothetical protein
MAGGGDFLRRVIHRRAADANDGAPGARDRHRDALADAGVGAGDEDAFSHKAEGIAHLS